MTGGGLLSAALTKSAKDTHVAKWTNIGNLAEMLQMDEQIKTLKEALRFYADAGNYAQIEDEGYVHYSPVQQDEGDVARAALRKTTT